MPEVEGVAAALPNKFDVGLSAGLAAPPNRPPVAGAVLAPPKSDVAGAEVEGVELPPPKRPDVGAGDVPPKSPGPAGFWAPVLCCPKSPPEDVAVVDAPAEAPVVADGKEKEEAPPPKRPPVAGAVVVVGLAAAPDELAVPKLKADMAATCRLNSFVRVSETPRMKLLLGRAFASGDAVLLMVERIQNIAAPREDREVQLRDHFSKLFPHVIME